MVSASWKLLVSSLWQKYCERKSSCRQTICAPRLTASPIRAIAFLRLTSGFGSQEICTSPRVTTGDDFFLGMRAEYSKVRGSPGAFGVRRLVGALIRGGNKAPTS